MTGQTMQAYMAENSRLEYIFFGGKGGVGKTVLAGTAALWTGEKQPPVGFGKSAEQDFAAAPGSSRRKGPPPVLRPAE